MIERKPTSVLLVDLDGVIRQWAHDDSQVELECGLPQGSIREVAFSDALLLPAIHGSVSDGSWRARISAELARLHPTASASEAVRRWSHPVGTVNQQVLSLLLQRCRIRIRSA